MAKFRDGGVEALDVEAHGELDIEASAPVCGGPPFNGRITVDEFKNRSPARSPKGAQPGLRLGNRA